MFQGLGQIANSVGFAIFCLILFHPTPTLQQTRCQPVNVGFNAALPWDISNTLRAPIGGPVAVMLSAIMAGILLFGLLLAPVHYVLGYPSRIYHPARQPGLISDLLYIDKERSLGGIETDSLLGKYEVIGNLSSLEFQARSFAEKEEDFLAATARKTRSIGSDSYPDFISTIFLFVEEEDVECRKVLLCHAHGILRSLPERFTKFIRYFSKRTTTIPENYKSAIILGLERHEGCLKAYNCKKEITEILKDIVYSLISSDFKSFWKLRKLF